MRIYNAETAEMAAKRLEEFANSEWGKRLAKPKSTQTQKS
jgi:transposase-like protein